MQHINSIEGTVTFIRSETKCSCCSGGKHITHRKVVYDEFDSELPSHFDQNEYNFIYSQLLVKNALEGRRVRLTIEILEN